MFSPQPFNAYVLFAGERGGGGEEGDGGGSGCMYRGEGVCVQLGIGMDGWFDVLLTGLSAK